MYTSHLSPPSILALTATVLLTTSCGELTYKRGATPRDLENAKKICSEKNDEMSAEACLKTNGWSVQKLNDIDLFAIPSINPDNRSVPNTQTSLKNSEREIGKKTTSSNANTTQAPEHTPDENFSIGSWWKIGGSDAILKSDINQCVEKLGDQYKPDIAKQKYSYALIVCLHDKGWKALVNVK